MLTHVKISNFKQFETVEFELGPVSVLVGPNNKGKTTALQALSLWSFGLQKWTEKRGRKSAAKKRTGVALSRLGLVSIPLLDMEYLWRGMRTRSEKKNGGGNILIEITVSGVSNGETWSCGLEFDHSNDETIYCRPLRTNSDGKPEIPSGALAERFALLPPMSGLALVEPKIEPGRINVLIGEGQTAQILRNLCYRIFSEDSIDGRWEELVRKMKGFFGVEILPPQYDPDRGEIRMRYRERSLELDIQAAGRGMQQTLLLLAHLYANPGAVLLLDEPDAHLEILRQRQIYHLLAEVAREQKSQIIAASHSEIILNEAAGRDVVVAFVGNPHRIDDRGKESISKSLGEIGFEDYYQAERRGWAIYLEGSTDLAILRTFARTLGHPAEPLLASPFVRYLGNEPQAGHAPLNMKSSSLFAKAQRHFYGLRFSNPGLVGIVMLDRQEKKSEKDPNLTLAVWRKKEIENYFCREQVLLDYARAEDPGTGPDWASVMAEVIEELANARRVAREPGIWSDDTKATDKVLDPLFENFYERLGLPNKLRKTNYHVLASFVSKDAIDPEVVEKLDLIVEVASRAKPVE